MYIQWRNTQEATTIEVYLEERGRSTGGSGSVEKILRAVMGKARSAWVSPSGRPLFSGPQSPRDPDFALWEVPRCPSSSSATSEVQDSLSSGLYPVPAGTQVGGSELL